mmetsp:Transcript_66997/g.105363  ORF Transcript_66997/g.105363 Transcript_66997/m.105363 type:complete len:82 (+) Transcript_66997:22-267(+)
MIRFQPIDIYLASGRRIPALTTRTAETISMRMRIERSCELVTSMGVLRSPLALKVFGLFGKKEHMCSCACFPTLAAVDLPL